MLEKVIENWTSRLDYIRASRGSPMPEIIFKIAFRRDSSQPETDENHLVRDQECMGDWYRRSQPGDAKWFCVAVAECGLVLSSNNRTSDIRSLGRFIRIASFNFDRVSQYRVALKVPTSKKSTQNLRGSQSESMFTVPSIQSESNLLALSQAKNSGHSKKLSTQMKNHSHASRIPSLDQSPSCHSAEWKTPPLPCPAS
ncbi:hypothetical protein TNCV_750841 [Trichonephila clavipes]|nr:hypothetical protein TNCV_750841 [Trichonephila clavipes]